MVGPVQRVDGDHLVRHADRERLDPGVAAAADPGGDSDLALLAEHALDVDPLAGQRLEPFETLGGRTRRLRFRRPHNARPTVTGNANGRGLASPPSIRSPPAVPACYAVLTPAPAAA